MSTGISSITRTVFAVIAFAGAAFGQSNGSISGTIKDTQGGVIPNASVTIADRALGVNQSAQTTSEGNFVFPQLPPGNYTLSVEVSGFKKLEKNEIVLPVSSKVNVGDIVLQVGSTGETVSVTAEAGQLQMQSESGERSNLVTNRQLRDIGLNGRNIVDLMRTIPG